MTSQVDIDHFFGNGGEALVREAVSFVFGRDNWARSLVGASSGWNERTPPAGVVTKQWFFPFTPGTISGVGGRLGKQLIDIAINCNYCNCNRNCK